VDHAAAAAAFNADRERTAWHDQALWFVRLKRDAAAAQVPEWEALRTAASRIREHTLSHLAEYLEQLEERATANGVQVHWAADAGEHNRIVHEILARHGAERLVKSKSMLTEECGLNRYLEARGIEVTDTDLGERIVQLAGQAPSHIVMPAIHFRKEEIGALFHEHLGTAAGGSDPQYLVEAARRHLRTRFLAADAALTGVNFAIAETGGFVVCTNEGNADLGAHLAPVHIACMGIEKVIPRAEHLGVFLRLLARSGTGQALTVYTSHFHRPRSGTELHLVIVDNGRSAHLGRAEFRNALKCIRCGACFNTCPVYRRSGGHSYGVSVAGPLGAVLAPARDPRQFSALPFASTLCGSCTAVCPVRIDLHEQLYRWRQQVAASYPDRLKATSARLAGRAFGSPRAYRVLLRLARSALRRLPRALLYRRGNAWGRARELPAPPDQSFRDWYAAHREAK
jgi:L-lactate dehydrogenase complex protein LldF